MAVIICGSAVGQGQRTIEFSVAARCRFLYYNIAYLVGICSDVDALLEQQKLGDGTGCHPCGGFTG
jgi:hypothetical protein